MNNYNLLLGSHINLKAPNYFLDTCKNAIEWQENCFMFYTGAPQNARRIDLSLLKIQEGKSLLIERGIELKNVIVHAPYIINLSNTINKDILEFGKEFLKAELQRVSAFGASILVLHPGSAVSGNKQEAIKLLTKSINDVLNADNSNVKIAIETMAGKGNEVGSTFEEINQIITNIEKKNRIGVCLDTCHINDAGYDVSLVDELINLFDQKIGLNNLLVIHLNDSLNPKGSHKDRHANIGEGTIGFETLLRYVYHPKLNGVPKILETPYINDMPPYKQEISMLRNKKYTKIC